MTTAAIRTEGLAKTFGATTALLPLDLEVAPGSGVVEMTSDVIAADSGVIEEVESASGVVELGEEKQPGPRDLASDSIAPVKRVVMVRTPGWRTPRIDMH